MRTQNQHQERPWGAKLNTHIWRKASDCPAWANRAQREKWDERGLILWDRDEQQITRLHAAQALEILEYVHTHEHWDQQDIVVGEPATRIVLGDPEQKPKQVLTDKMTLCPDRLRDLVELLESSESTLQRMAEEDEADRRRRLSQVYRMILGWGQQASGEEATDPQLNGD